MNSIVVTTDFSKPAENAMLFAGQLAKQMNASLLLVHMYQIPVGMNEVPLLIMSADELKQNVESSLDRAKEILESSIEGLDIKTETRLGDVVTELADICENERPFFIVTGKHGAAGLERVLFGSTSLSIVRHSKIPVIVVPENAHPQRLKRLAMAIDNTGIKLPLAPVKRIVEALNCELHVIHVQQGKTESPVLNSIVSELNASCKTIRDDDFVHGIDSYIKSNNIDMLVVLPHKHSLLERLFSTTHTAELASKLDVPMMCVNA